MSRREETWIAIMVALAGVLIVGAILLQPAALVHGTYVFLQMAMVMLGLSLYGKAEFEITLHRYYERLTFTTPEGSFTVYRRKEDGQ
jgi:hypothetical protein